MFDECHNLLKFVLTINDSLLHQLQGLCDQPKLVNYFIKGLFNFWLQLSVSNTSYGFLGGQLVGIFICLADRIIEEIRFGIEVCDGLVLFLANFCTSGCR